MSDSVLNNYVNCHFWLSNNLAKLGSANYLFAQRYLRLFLNLEEWIDEVYELLMVT